MGEGRGVAGGWDRDTTGTNEMQKCKSKIIYASLLTAVAVAVKTCRCPAPGPALLLAPLSAAFFFQP